MLGALSNLDSRVAAVLEVCLVYDLVLSTLDEVDLFLHLSSGICLVIKTSHRSFDSNEASC